MNHSTANIAEQAQVSAARSEDREATEDLTIPEERAETVVAEAFSQVLSVDQVNPDAPFAALGGDSLRAVRVLSRVWRELGIELPVHSLRANTTAAELAEIIHTYGQAS
jgi:acyl carrier protein